MTVAITCAGCRRSLRVDEGLIGQSVRCPLCVETFVAEADAIQPPPVQKPAPRRVAVAAVEDDRPGAAVVATPVAAEEDPPAEPRPAVPARPTKAFKPLSFAVLFAHDPDRLLRGRADAELSVDGLRVRLRSRRDLWAGVCGSHPARYAGANRLAVFLDGREVTLTLVRARTDLNRLARDVVAFLNGGRAELNLRDYRLPWKLTLVPWLAVVVPCLAIWLRVLGGVHGGGRFLWFLVAGLAVLFGFLAMRRETTSTGRRLALAGTYVGVCFLLLAGAFAYRVAHPNTVPAREWQALTLPGQRFRVLMPGSPRKEPRQVGGLNSTVYTVQRYSLGKTFVLGIGTVDRDQNFPGDNARSILGGRRSALESETPHLSVRYEAVSSKIGDASAQVVMKLPTYSEPEQHNIQVTRLILSGDQLYTLTVKGDDMDPDDPDVKKFFDSFQLVAAGVPPSPKDLPGVVAYWSFENQDRRDGRTGYADVSWVQGVRGEAASLRGPGSYINLDNYGDVLNFGDNQPFSCVGWFKTQTWDQRAYVLSMHGPNAVKLELCVQNGGLVAELNTFPGGDERALGSALRGPPVNDGAWHHFALTREAGGAVTLYVDGTTAAANLAGVMTSGALTTKARSFGCRRTATWNPPEGHLTGALDEVAFFNRCLSAVEIAKLSRSDAP